MKAVVITKPGPPEVLQLQEVEEPAPGPDELLVTVRATALNRADLLQRLGRYPAPPGAPERIPGLEIAGIVEQIGPRVREFQPGDSVMGLLAGGGYAEKIVIHERLALPIPAGLSFEEAASLPECFLTAFDALFERLRISFGESILIHAAGSGIGVAAIQLARAAGLWTFGTAGSDEKLEQARRLGLEIGINRHSADFQKIVRKQTGGHGVDTILDVVGQAFWRQNLECLATRGRMLILGLLSGPMTEVDLSPILRKRLTIMGSVLRSRSLEEKIHLVQSFRRSALSHFAEKRLRPVVAKIYPLEKAADAHTWMEENRNFGKIVLRVS